MPMIYMLTLYDFANIVFRLYLSTRIHNVLGTQYFSFALYTYYNILYYITTFQFLLYLPILTLTIYIYI